MPVSRVYSPVGWRVLEANGASIANNAFIQADDADFNLDLHGSSYPNLEFELVWTHATAPTANSVLQIFAQDRAVGSGAQDARVPSANNLQLLIATVRVDAVTTAQSKRFDVLKAPTNAAYWVYANGVTNAVSVGWTLRARAFSF